MQTEDKKTSEEWMDLLNKERKFSLLDPDGWDRNNFKYSFYKEKITMEEFFIRLSLSTCSGNIKDISNKL